MPALFLGHGSPMNAVEDNEYTRGWAELAKEIPTPKAIVIVSAHWETQGTKVFAGEKPPMIYDMYGFPQNLYEVKYPAPGSPELAEQISASIHNIAPTHDWGLDHGAWSVLVKMFPEASIPCFQLSLNKTRDFQWHYELATQLKFLRKKGVLVLGSGNIIHNLRAAMMGDPSAFEWSQEFDELVATKILDGDHKSLVNVFKLGRPAELSVNSAEHYIPLLYTLALREKDEPIEFSNHSFSGSLPGISMRCLRVG